ncbi:Gfo/Idh/MocA family protein [Cellvibrio japonicus]|uniref:Oxidoreductase n=1 Tax=Cellvibrio japonicus (strain Ueda107) TaxID=498211 RepID=B3PBI5_CELJU|nr:Gfo/Idh/MocA family oxidoreductase [Cellvibrio japonicus]ACE83218.1 oxidoreductase [Cellvibrio japonicus Ueda107]QEI13099.1 Gfo/Idh/MocA family oxidoreductase [Cellvibrio japonicus]QEI16673.1 Gfo/Idh/MocA family oxidoreductase [Cellvibrio japonicus]QEI20251.1 Gfo/Idh/MocA family oxidoreductase [Cellvibrio japonicus]
MKTIRWGIIGVGDVCEVKSGPAFYKAPASQLLAVMRRDPAKAQDYALRHGVPLWSDKAQVLLDHPDIDAIYIATPPAQHKDYAIAALRAGKHVYIEKPVTLNAAECDAIIAAEQHSGKRVCAAHYRRYVPCFNHVIELIRRGAIGTPLLVQLDMLQPAASSIITTTDDNWRVNPALSGGGLFHDLSPHQLDLMLHWFGPVISAQGFAINQRRLNPADDCVHGWAQLQSGVVLQGRWHFAVAPGQTRDLCEVIGSSGRITINFFGQQVIRLYNSEGEQEFTIPNPPHIQQPMIEQVNAYFRGERDNPCSMAQAKAVMALIDCFSQGLPHPLIPG